MNCSTCKRETSPIKISGQDYCSVCGNLYTPASKPEAAGAPAAKRLSMDLSPRKAGVVTASIPHPAPKPAAAMHSRVKPAHVLDLRATDKAPAAAEPAVSAAVVQHAHHTPAVMPKSAAKERHSAQLSDRLDQAKKYSRSPIINKFAGPGVPATLPVVAPAAAPAAAVQAASVLATGSELPKMAVTHHEAMTRLVPAATAAAVPEAPMAKTKAQRAWRPNLVLSPRNNRVMATAAAITIMAGYVWLQNYPKLALQAASGKAGISASLPGYVPSSYNLSRTDTAPGVVTLSFLSPSATESLKIAQTRTTWDSSSLLDNFVSKKADDYATVQGQGLTIYLFNNNQATWVNHGTWYTIEGAARLSREQVLKMAYSL